MCLIAEQLIIQNIIEKLMGFNTLETKFFSNKKINNSGGMDKIESYIGKVNFKNS